MTYTMKNIVELTRTTVRYLDESNTAHEIDLLECSRNWVAYGNGRGGDFITWDGDIAPPKSFETNTCVGERDTSAPKPYVEFCSNPKIRFEVATNKGFADIFRKHPKQKRKQYMEFRKLCFDLEHTGWTTFDLG